MLRNLVLRLPSMGGSHYVEAMRNDPVVIQRMLDKDEDEAPGWTPSGTEWDQSTELLTKLLDQITALVAIMAAHPIPAGGRRPNIPKPHPRPARLIDKYRLERVEREHAELDDEVEQAKARYREAQARGELPADDN